MHATSFIVAIIAIVILHRQSDFPSLISFSLSPSSSAPSLSHPRHNHYFR
jgi:hypothetical protein